MKNLKHLFTVLLLMCTTVATAYDFYFDGIYYNILNGEYVEVTSSGLDSEKYSGFATIPESVTYNGITYRVTRIGDSAFSGSSDLLYVIIPDGVTSIGDYAFKGCSRVSTIEIPQSITSVGKNVFEDTSWYKTKGSGIVYVGKTVYKYKGKMSSNHGLEFGDGITQICNNAFQGTGLASIKLGEGLLSIGDNAFAGCNIESVVIPSNVTSIGNGAFYGCSKLANVTFKGGFVNMGKGVFDGTAFYNNQPEGVVYIGNLLYKYKGTMPENTEIVVNDGTLWIAAYAFNNCSGLTNIIIPNSVTGIGDDAFYGTAWYDEQPEGIVYAGKVLYKYKGVMPENTEIKINDGTLGVATSAFEGCPTFNSITIPNSVATIGLDAISSKKVIWLTNTPPRGYNNVNAAINYVANKQYTELKNTIVYSYLSSLFEVRGVKYVPVSPAERTCDVIDCLYNDVEEFVIDSVVLFKGVTMYVKEVMPYTFHGNRNINSLKINNSGGIGKHSITNCTNLVDVVIGNGVTNIDNNVFDGCISLKDLRIEDGEEHLSLGYNSYSKDKSLFYDCPLETMYLGRDLSYQFENSYTQSPFFNKKIKSAVLGECVTSIKAYMFYQSLASTSLVIPNSVTSIGEYAFYNCGLKSVTIGNGVTSIGDYAFSGCYSLENIIIGNSVTKIGNSAFDNCKSLKDLRIEDGVGTLFLGYNKYKSNDIGEGLFNDCPLETLYLGRDLSYEESSKYGYSPFYSGATLKLLIIGDNVTSIRNSTFYNCSDLFNAVIGNSVTSIGDNAFYGCSSLTSVTIGNSVTSVGVAAFYGCSSLTNVEIPSSVTSIGKSSFYNCSSLTSVVMGNSVTSIGDNAFYGCSSLTSTTIGDNVKNIGRDAFLGCTSLTAVRIDDIVAWCNIDFANAYANPLYNAKNLYLRGELLTELVIPNSIMSIKFAAFYGCSGLTSVVVGKNVTSIAKSAFAKCTGLSNIVIGNSVTSIGDYAFSGCYSLMSVVIPQSVTKIANYVFANCSSLTDVVIEDNSTALSLGSNGSSSLFVDCPLDSVYIGRKINYNISSSYGYSPFYRNTSLRTVVITDTETEIYDNEFYGCSNLKNVSIGDGVNKIGKWAFSGCASLDCFAFGKNVQSIGTEAFSDCNNITRILTSAINPPVCGAQALDDINKWNCTLYIPNEAKSAYLAAEQWKDFFFVEDLPVGINSVLADYNNDGVYYDLNGRAVENPTSGIYIINGKKVLLK